MAKSKMTFEPIAIVGRGCVLPGCLDPAALWRTVVDGRVHVTAPPDGHWRVDLDRALSANPADRHPDGSWSDGGGYVTGFDAVFEPGRYVPVGTPLRELDPVFQWSLHAARQALDEVTAQDDALRSGAGLILGNLSYPTPAYNRLAERYWLGQAYPGLSMDDPVHPLNRFMSGLPATLVARSLGLGGACTALDAACASGLYAIKIACDRLQHREADLMLAGAVNASDMLFLHVGFCALNAMSRSGRSRPLDAAADGLVPAEGAAFVALKRLDDALAHGDTIYGILRGIGLTNDGRSGGFLSPSEAGQVRSMQAAYAMAGCEPADVSLVECHATGTVVGDAAEIRSMNAVFGSSARPAIGSLKANLGHTITVSGVAGLLKVVAAFEAETLPGTPIEGTLNPEVATSGFPVLRESRPWPSSKKPRLAAVSSFGFGGNNAHLIVEEPAGASRRVQVPVTSPYVREMPLALVGLGVRTHLSRDTRSFAQWLKGGPADAPRDTSTVRFPASGLAFPPNDLNQTLGQQLLMLAVAEEALAGVHGLDLEQTGLFIGMGADPEICRYGLRFRLSDYLDPLHARAGRPVESAERDAIVPPLQAAGVVGTMPNIPANRLNNQFRFQGMGFTVSNEELSGDTALELATSALRRGELQAALVGAVDFSRHPVHELAANAVLDGPVHSADAAVALVLKPLERARQDGDRVLAVLDGASPTNGHARSVPDALSRLGEAHAAKGLLAIAAAVMMGADRFEPETPDTSAYPRLPGSGVETLTILNRSFTGVRKETTLQFPAARTTGGARPISLAPLRVYPFAATSPAELKHRMEEGVSSLDGTCRLAVVASDGEARERIARAVRMLDEKPTDRGWVEDGIVFSPAPVQGEVAFAYAGSGSVYRGMGRTLLLHHPELLDHIAPTFGDLRRLTGWIYEDETALSDSPFAQLCGSSLFSQVHTAFTRDILKIRPDAALGLSSGETNSLFALGVWSDMDGLMRDIEASGLYSEACAGDFAAVQAHWGDRAPVDWQNWLLPGPIETVRAALAGEDRAYLTIIQTPTASVISGDAAACARVIARAGIQHAQPLDHELACHCPAILPFEPKWRKLHTRPVTPQAGVRFYSNYLDGVYTPTEASVADALTGQAFRTIDLPRIVRKAWDDGVRIFVEHGPRNILSQSIRSILGERPHLSVPLDVAGVSSLEQAYVAAARLWCAGVDADIEALGPAHTEEPSSPMLEFPLYMPPVRLPKMTVPAIGANIGDPAESGGRFLPRPPSPGAIYTRDESTQLSSSDGGWTMPDPSSPAPSPSSYQGPAHPDLHRPPVSDPAAALQPPSGADLLARAYSGLADGHRHFMEQMARSHGAFTELLTRVQNSLLQPGAPEAAYTDSPLTAPEGSPPALAWVQAPSPSSPSPPSSDTTPQQPAAPLFDRHALEVHAGGRISEIFGPLFEQQDGYAVQVRMPEPPLLLCDRVTRIEGEPGSMGVGTVWTETDIREDNWYLHNGRMPAGIFIEAGQADLFLISWLGVDFLNKGRRAYRLLGCELTFHGPLPEIGDTLEYEIHVDGHAAQGDVRLFFFHYDCLVRGERRISVRSGQAGFFTEAELAQSAGVLWEASSADYTPSPRLAPAPIRPLRDRFTEAEVVAYTEGDLIGCFGQSHRGAGPHTRTPRGQGGAMNLLERITRLDPEGGPARRGYLEARTAVDPEAWFFDGHFKNDPCMPGTLMAEATLQAMAFYLVALGFTVDRDGWRFEPVPEESFTFVCRGQVTPASKELVYEVFVDELVDGPVPTLYAHVLCSVDGLKAFLCERLALRLVPDYPITSHPELVRSTTDRGAAALDGFPFDYASLLHCAWGPPTAAFGPRYRLENPAQRVPRLPGPPYHFMTRIARVDGTFGQARAGAEVEAVYDIPPDAWYFDEQGADAMPFCVLVEAALQPCGWLASFVLDDASRNTELLFRNLDGKGVVHRPVRRDDGQLVTRARLTTFAAMGGQIIIKFDVLCRVGDAVIYTLDTAFGFFAPEAMVDQKGIPAGEEESAQYTQEENLRIDLTDRPTSLFGGPGPRLPGGDLLMIDRITGFLPDGGRHGAGWVRAEKDVNPRDWFFKAHFFQDPVQPGSLGIEAMLQVLQFYVLQAHPELCGPEATFEPILCDVETEWHFRGQITPANGRIGVDMEVLEVGRNEKGPYVLAEARLWGDGKKIYHAPRIGMQIVERAAREDRPVDSLSRAFAAGGIEPLHPEDRSAESLSRAFAAGGIEPLPFPADRFDFEAGSGGRCLNLPVNRLVEGPSPAIAPIDTDMLREGWVSLAGVERGFVHDLIAAMIRQFIRWVVFERPEDRDRLRGRPVLYLANHQVAAESLLMLAITTALEQMPAIGMAKIEHGATWVGRLQQIADAQLAGRNPSSMLLLDRADKRHMLKMLGDFAGRVQADPASLLVHVEGTRSVQCGRPVAQLSSVLLDLAVQAGLPVVPVRFYGGLPRDPVEERLEFPWQFGRQDLYFGAAIDPEDMKTLGIRERRDLVLRAMQTLGPAHDREQPLPGDAEFAEQVATHRRERGTTFIGGVLLEALLRLPDPCPETRTEVETLLNPQVSDERTGADGQAAIRALIYGS